MRNHSIFNDSGEVSAGIHRDKSENGLGGEGFKKAGGVFLGNCFIHFKCPGTSFDSGEFAVGNDSDFYLDFSVKTFWEARMNGVKKGGGRMKFGVFFKEPADLRDVRGLNRVLIKAEAVFLKKRNDKGVMFDGIKADRGAEGSVNCAKVGGEILG